MTCTIRLASAGPSRPIWVAEAYLGAKKQTDGGKQLIGLSCLSLWHFLYTGRRYQQVEIHIPVTTRISLADRPVVSMCENELSLYLAECIEELM